MNSKWKLLLFIFFSMQLGGCSSKKQTSDNNSAEEIFGKYQHRASGNASLELHRDSTVTLQIKKNSVPVAENKEAFKNTGTFTFRNDSIFITWENGREVKSKFEKKNGLYTFRIGATRYEKE
jgi:hypothetical protein